MEFKDILITGSNSGLGKYCWEYFGGTGFTRQTDITLIQKQAAQKPFDAIIHCAFNTQPEVSAQQLYSYLQDTLFLTNQLVRLPHRKFIFISSVDVYPKDGKFYSEDEMLNSKNMESIYGLSKLISESIVQHETKNHLILRLSALLGVHIRKNSLMRIFTEPEAMLTLSEKSLFNYILHSDVSHFIEKAFKQDLQGIYNLTASTDITLGEVAKLFNKRAHFGSYTYITGRGVNAKAASVADVFKRGSLDSIELFMKGDER